jgi:hypothetical protein
MTDIYKTSFLKRNNLGKLGYKRRRDDAEIKPILWRRIGRLENFSLTFNKMERRKGQCEKQGVIF